MEQRANDRKNLRIFSILFLVFAAIEAIDLIIFLTGEGIDTAALAQQAQVSESFARTTAAVVIALGALSTLVLLYLGLMGLRQSKGQTTSSSHITIAKICMVFLVIVLISALVNVVSSPTKDWLELFSSMASVAIGLIYIRSAKNLQA